MQKSLYKEWFMADDEEKSVQPPQLIVDYFSFEELHSIMCKNQLQILGLFD